MSLLSKNLIPKKKMTRHAGVNTKISCKFAISSVCLFPRATFSCRVDMSFPMIFSKVAWNQWFRWGPVYPPGAPQNPVYPPGALQFSRPFGRFITGFADFMFVRALRAPTPRGPLKTQFTPRGVIWTTAWNSRERDLVSDSNVWLTCVKSIA